MTNASFKPIAILGAGSWGTALALYLSRRGQVVHLWSNVSTEIASLIADKSNKQYLPGFDFPNLIQPTDNLSKAIEGTSEAIIVVPSIAFRDVLNHLKPLLKPGYGLACATKGLDGETGLLLSEVAHQIVHEQPFAVLAGPSFAREVASGLPTAVVIASRNNALRTQLLERFNSTIFHARPSDDVIGVEVGSVVKNVIAIATGIVDGLEFGPNARSALLTNGLAEMIRLGEALGGKLETFLGLSGIGDLILTATDDQSRNRRFGLSLGRGQNLEKAEKEIGQIVEGKRNAELVMRLAERHKIAMPICERVWKILQAKLQVKEAAMEFIF